MSRRGVFFVASCDKLWCFSTGVLLNRLQLTISCVWRKTVSLGVHNVGMSDTKFSLTWWKLGSRNRGSPRSTSVCGYQSHRVRSTRPLVCIRNWNLWFNPGCTIRCSYSTHMYRWRLFLCIFIELYTPWFSCPWSILCSCDLPLPCLTCCVDLDHVTFLSCDELFSTRTYIFIYYMCLCAFNGYAYEFVSQRTLTRVNYGSMSEFQPRA